MIDSELAVCLSRAHGPRTDRTETPLLLLLPVLPLPLLQQPPLCSLRSRSPALLLLCTRITWHGRAYPVATAARLQRRRQQPLRAAAAAAAAFRGCYLGPPVGGALIFKLLKMLQAHTHTGRACINTHTHTFNLNLTAKYFTHTGRREAAITNTQPPITTRTRRATQHSLTLLCLAHSHSLSRLCCYCFRRLTLSHCCSLSRRKQLFALPKLSLEGRLSTTRANCVTAERRQRSSSSICLASFVTLILLPLSSSSLLVN